MVNLKDIALQAGVSVSTVSRVVNGKRYINSEKREKILEIIEKTGYVPNKAAQTMATEQSFTVGIVIPDTFNMFQRQLFSVIERYLNSFSYHTMFFFVKFDSSSEKNCVDRLKSEKLAGVILLHNLTSPTFYDFARQTCLPVVSCTIRSEADVPVITINDKQAALDAVNHLIGLGHRKIDLLCGSRLSFSAERAAGYYEALAAAGVERDDNRVVFVQQYNMESGIYGMRELLLRSRDFTALFAASDEIALGAIRALRDEGLRVPEDVSVIGIDNIETADYFVPRLTTIHQPIQEIGEQTVLGLHRRIADWKGAAPEIVIPHRLIVRESTGAVNPSV